MTWWNLNTNAGTRRVGDRVQWMLLPVTSLDWSRIGNDKSTSQPEFHIGPPESSWMPRVLRRGRFALEVVALNDRGYLFEVLITSFRCFAQASAELCLP